MAEAHEHTWFTTQGLSEPVCRKVGCRPGDPLGDIIYNFTAAKVLGGIEQEAVEAGVVEPPPPASSDACVSFVPNNDPISIIDDDFVDDSIFFARNKSPALLVEKAKLLCGIVARRFFQHGLPLNKKNNKSECMFNFRGPGAKEAEASLLINEHGEIQVTILGIGTLTLRVVDRYDHMGSTLAAKSGASLEIVKRVGSMMAVFRPIRVRVFEILVSHNTFG